MLRLGTLGAGYFSQFHYEAWGRIADVDLVALCDHDAEAAQAAALSYGTAKTYSDLGAMLAEERLDLVAHLRARGETYARQLAARYALVPAARAGRFLR